MEPLHAGRLTGTNEIEDAGFKYNLYETSAAALGLATAGAC
jgi:hypothetical protein